MTEPKTVQIAPIAALRLVTAERDFLRNHALLLEHSNHELTGQVKAQAEELAALKQTGQNSREDIQGKPK